MWRTVSLLRTTSTYDRKHRLWCDDAVEEKSAFNPVPVGPIWSVFCLNSVFFFALRLQMYLYLETTVRKTGPNVAFSCCRSGSCCVSSRVCFLNLRWRLHKRSTKTPAGKWTDLLCVYLVVHSGSENIGSGLMKKPQQGVNNVPVLYYYNTVEYVLLVVSWERELCNWTFCKGRIWCSTSDVSTCKQSVFPEMKYLFWTLQFRLHFRCVLLCGQHCTSTAHSHTKMLLFTQRSTELGHRHSLRFVLVCTLAGGHVSCLDALSCYISCFPLYGEVKAPRVITWRSEVVAAFLTTDVQFAKRKQKL